MTGKRTSAEGWSGEKADREPEVASQTHTCAHWRPPAALLHPGRPRVYTGITAPPHALPCFCQSLVMVGHSHLPASTQSASIRQGCEPTWGPCRRGVLLTLAFALSKSTAMLTSLLEEECPYIVHVVAAQCMVICPCLGCPDIALKCGHLAFHVWSFAKSSLWAGR